MASNTHRCKIHKYRRAPNQLWACMNCGHFMPKHLSWRLESAEAICNGCDLPFKMSAEALQEDSPKCASCRGENEVYTGIAEVLAKLEKTGTE